jgi:hypothetical protein
MDKADDATVIDEPLDEPLADAKPEAEAAQGATEAEAAEDVVSDEVIVTIGEETPPPVDEFDGKPAPVWVKDLRKQARDLARENRELKQKLQQPAPQTALALPQKPTLENCDYDAEKFEAELEGWHDKKRAVDEQKRQADSERDAAQREWQGKLDAYTKDKAALKVADFDEAEEAVRAGLSELQQSVILSGCEKPALLVAAIGMNPSKVKELAAIKDPVKFAFAVAKLETQLKVTQRTPAAPPPEKVVRGNVAGAAAVDRTLEKLVEEAARTGNGTKLREYKASKKAAANK